MVWPILLVVGIVVVIGLFLYRKDHGSKDQLNLLCLSCHERFSDDLLCCPHCGEEYFNFNQK